MEELKKQMTGDEIANEMCEIIDLMESAKLEPGTPLHRFQQVMIENVKNYREGKRNEI